MSFAPCATGLLLCSRVPSLLIPPTMSPRALALSRDRRSTTTMAQHHDLVSEIDVRQCWALNENKEEQATLPNCLSAELRMPPPVLTRKRHRVPQLIQDLRPPVRSGGAWQRTYAYVHQHRAYPHIVLAYRTRYSVPSHRDRCTAIVPWHGRLPDRCLKSDCDEELLIHIVFVQKVRLSGLQIKAPAGSGPKSVKLIVNVPSHSNVRRVIAHLPKPQALTLTRRRRSTSTRRNRPR